MSRNVAFVCLGTMGYPMAGHLAAAENRVTVYNRTAARADAWVAAHGGVAAATPGEAAADAEVVFVCSGNDHDVRTVVLGDDGILAGMGSGAVLVDHTTDSPALARELAGLCAERDLGFLDAPVSGGQAGAEDGALTVMIGGDAEVYAGVRPLIDRYAKKSLLLGPAGSGQLAKAVNQICIAGLVQALSEGLRFGVKAGLDVSKVVEVISQGAAQSWQMDHRATTMLEGRFDFGFAVDWMRKDLGIALAEADRNGAELPVTRIVNGFYQELQEAGGRRWDTSSLIQRLA
jgi:3-hydroxyisobutyrate dehydrogenase-like beta-hydroxyacid dehydrogenase